MILCISVNTSVAKVRDRLLKKESTPENFRQRGIPRWESYCAIFFIFSNVAPLAAKNWITPYVYSLNGGGYIKTDAIYEISMANILEIGRFQFPNIRYYDVITVFHDVTNNFFHIFDIIWLVAYQMQASEKCNTPESISSDLGTIPNRGDRG